MTMKRAIRVFLWVGIAALSLAPWAIAQNVVLTSAGSTVADGIYVSPYYATVNGVPNTKVVCDDFADDSHLNTAPWSASIVSLSSLASTSNLLNTAWGAAGKTFLMYEEAAWLTMPLLSQTAGTPGQVNYSYAVWAVFDPIGVANWLNSYGDTATYNAVFGPNGYLAGAAAAASSFTPGEFSNVLIITPTVGGGACTAGGCPEQEFIEVVPEGGVAMGYVFLASLCCFGAMFLRSRRQMGSVPAA